MAFPNIKHNFICSFTELQNEQLNSTKFRVMLFEIIDSAIDKTYVSQSILFLLRMFKNCIFFFIILDSTFTVQRNAIEKKKTNLKSTNIIIEEYTHIF